MMINLMQTLLTLKSRLAIGVLLSNILLISTTYADTLKDPTTPPASLNTSAPEGNSTAVSPILQSIMIGPHYHAAIINGEKVLLGKKYQAATLIKLNEHEAVLRHPDMHIETLSMNFAVNKKTVSTVFNETKARHALQPYAKPNTTPIEVSEK